MTKVHITGRVKYLGSDSARASMGAAGWKLVDSPDEADWVIACHQDEVPDLIGRVPNVLLHTYEPAYTLKWPLDSNEDGTRVHSVSPWTLGVGDTWRFWLHHGPKNYLDPRGRTRGSMCILASVHPHRHALHAEDLTAVRYDLAVRAWERGLIDLYGRGWGDIPVEEDSRFPEVGSRSGLKHGILERYAINICLESAHVRGFVTEKLWEAIRAGCLPVYFGSTWLDEIFPRGDYVDLRDFADQDELLDYLVALPPAEVVDRVLRLQASLRELEAREPRSSSTADGWVADAIGYINYREETVRRVSAPFGGSPDSILDHVPAKLPRVAAEAEAKSGTRIPPHALESAPGLKVFVSDMVPYMKERERLGLWAQRGYRVVDSPREADWAIAYHQRELGDLAGVAPRVVMHTYEPLFTRTLPLYSRIAGSEVYSFSPWTGGLKDTWKYWLRYGPQDVADPADGERSGAVILASTKAWAHDGFAEDLTGLRHRIAVQAQKRGLMEIYGRDWGDIPVVEDSRHPDGESFSTVKHRILSKYAFNLCLENNHVPGFVTEKPWQAIRGGCLPIYYGSSWMDELIAPGAYLDLRDFGSLEELFDTMEAMSREEIIDRVRSLQASLRELEAANDDARMKTQGAVWASDVMSFVQAIDDGVRRQSTGWSVSSLGARDYALACRAGVDVPTARALPALPEQQSALSRWWKRKSG